MIQSNDYLLHSGPPVPPTLPVIEGTTIHWNRPTTSDPAEPLLQYEILLYRYILSSLSVL